MDDLRDYQLRAIELSRAELRKGTKRLLINSPTGSGKTVIAEAMIRSALDRGKRVAFLANRVQLIKQTSKRLQDIPHGIIQGNNTINSLSDFVIASIQTVSRRGLPDVDVIIIDEAHGVAGSNEYKTLIARYNNLPIIGLSATPFSKGLGAYNKDIGGNVFEALVIAATIKDLIQEGHLVDCDIYAPSEPDLSKVKTKENRFGEVEYIEGKDLEDAVDKPSLIGDIVDHWKKLANNKPTVVFATNVAHSEHITAEFIKHGVLAEHIDYRTEPEDRQAIMQRVSEGKTRVISNVGILTEGWDFPACEVMILARPTKSLIRWIQMVGRVLRPSAGKEKALVLDHSGSAKDLGYPTEDFPLYLDDGTPNKSSTRKSEEKEPSKPKKCPSCSFMKPAGIHKCPNCNFEPAVQNTIEVEAGTLEKVNRSLEKKQAFTQEQKQQFYSELLSIKFAKGYKDGWVANQYRNKFGVWPKSMRRVASEPSKTTKDFLKHEQIKYAKGKEKMQKVRGMLHGS